MFVVTIRHLRCPPCKSHSRACACPLSCAWPCVARKPRSGAATVLAPHVVLDQSKVAAGQYTREDDGASSAEKEDEAAALLVPPRVGRHLSFDGRWLHGAPASVLPGTGQPPYERITFCVNVWVGHRPAACPRFAEAGSGSSPDGSRGGSDHGGLMAPRLRLGAARSVAAQREARGLKLARLRCDAGAAPAHCMRLEQTDEAHEFLLPTPGWLGSARAPWAEVRRRGFQAVALHGAGVVLRRASAAPPGDVADGDGGAGGGGDRAAGDVDDGEDGDGSREHDQPGRPTAAGKRRRRSEI